MYKLLQEELYLLVCALTKTACDPKMKHTGKLLVAFMNAAITLISQQPIGIPSVQNLTIVPTQC